MTKAIGLYQQIAHQEVERYHLMGWYIANNNLGWHRCEYSVLMHYPCNCRSNGMLTFDELREKNLNRCVNGFKHELNSWSIAEWGNATAGECGEACNVAKKILRFRDGVAGNKKSEKEYRVDLASEIAGMVIYADLWAAAAGIDLAKAIKEEFNKKSEEIGSDIIL